MEEFANRQIQYSLERLKRGLQKTIGIFTNSTDDDISEECVSDHEKESPSHGYYQKDLAQNRQCSEDAASHIYLDESDEPSTDATYDLVSGDEEGTSEKLCGKKQNYDILIEIASAANPKLKQQQSSSAKIFFTNSVNNCYQPEVITKEFSESYDEDASDADTNDDSESLDERKFQMLAPHFNREPGQIPQMKLQNDKASEKLLTYIEPVNARSYSKGVSASHFFPSKYRSCKDVDNIELLIDVIKNKKTTPVKESANTTSQTYNKVGKNISHFHYEFEGNDNIKTCENSNSIQTSLTKFPFYQHRNMSHHLEVFTLNDTGHQYIDNAESMKVFVIKNSPKQNVERLNWINRHQITDYPHQRSEMEQETFSSAIKIVAEHNSQNASNVILGKRAAFDISDEVEGKISKEKTTVPLCNIKKYQKIIQAETIQVRENISKDPILSNTYNGATYFDDGIREIDFILVCNEQTRLPITVKQFETYMSNLKVHGVQVEYSISEKYPNYTFIKLHLPLDICLAVAKRSRIHLSFQGEHNKFETPAILNCMDTLLTSANREDHTLCTRNQESIIGNQPRKPTTCERISVIDEVLKMTKYGDNVGEYGLEDLIDSKVLKAAYPLHDRNWAWTANGYLSDRQLLNAYWASFMNCFQKQPIQLIAKYFGAETGFYFALLGFYTTMLVPTGLMGICMLLYGVGMLGSSQIVKDICAAPEKYIMCPTCNRTKNCWFSRLNDSCIAAKSTYIFDNTPSIVFGMIIPFWAIVLSIVWKRIENSNRIAWGLNFINVDNSTRAAHQRCRTERRRPSGHADDLGMRNLGRCTNFAVSFGTILFFIALMLLSTFAIIIYRASAIGFFSSIANVQYGKTATFVVGRSLGGMITSLSSSVGVAIFIIIFGLIYEDVAIWLTKRENPRTQMEFDDAFLFKLFILAFVNNYSVAFYLVLFRGTSYTHPGDSSELSRWRNKLGFNEDVCDPSGCFLDLWILVFVILILKGLYNLLFNMFVPITEEMLMLGRKRCPKRPQWELDFELRPQKINFLARLFTELVIQYGFVIFFVSSLPIVPLLALINNSIEIRVTAIKLVRVMRRTIPKKIHGIDMWHSIIWTMTYIGIVINATVIGFSSSYIPRLIYKNNHTDLGGFIYTTLSVFSTKDFNEEKFQNVFPECYYRGKRVPFFESNKYALTKDYYYELLWKLWTVVILTLISLIAALFLYFTVSDISSSARKELEIRKIQKSHSRAMYNTDADKNKEVE